jgi:predicted DsbA family dithiol-disulfide isomerase
VLWRLSNWMSQQHGAMLFPVRPQVEALAMAAIFDHDFRIGVSGGILLASLCLNIFFLLTKADRSFIPSVLDKFVYATPTVGPADHVLGPPDARVRIVEYSDYQCAYCKTMNDRFKSLLKENPQVAWIMRNRPLPTHRYSEIASEAAECANEQGAYWHYNDLLFERQANLVEPAVFESIAQTLALDEGRFVSCFRAARYARKVTEDLMDAQHRGISRTPTFYINGQRFVGAIELADLRQIVASQLDKTVEIKK